MTAALRLQTSKMQEDKTKLGAHVAQLNERAGKIRRQEEAGQPNDKELTLLSARRIYGCWSTAKDIICPLRLPERLRLQMI